MKLSNLRASGKEESASIEFLLRNKMKMRTRVKARFVMKEGNRWVCRLCPVHCKMREGDRGICRGREIIDDVPYAVNYGEVVALHIDPIEKNRSTMSSPGS